MNSFPFISHHLFVSAAGHENRPQVKTARNQNEASGANPLLAARNVPAERVVEPETPRQLELLAGAAGAG
jgi:hypothetical protein